MLSSPLPFIVTVLGPQSNSAVTDVMLVIRVHAVFNVLMTIHFNSRRALLRQV
jgi:hypothetical protein